MGGNGEVVRLSVPFEGGPRLAAAAATTTSLVAPAEVCAEGLGVAVEGR